MSASSILVRYRSHLQSVVHCLWHLKLNQIVVGCADKVFFSGKHSLRYTALSSQIE